MGDLLNEIDFNAFEEEFKLPQKKKVDNKNPDKVDDIAYLGCTCESGGFV